MTFRLSIFAIILVGLSSLASAESKLEVQKIAGKTPEEVVKVLGKPSGQDKTKQGPKRLYKGGMIEVVYIGGKADWITVSNMRDVPFNANALEVLGLKPTPPTTESNLALRWAPYGTYTSVSIFNASGHVDYAYIKVATK